MPVQKPIQEKVRFWRSRDFFNMEVLRATYLTRSFPKHFHEEFGIGLVEQGRLIYYSQGTRYIIPAGHLVLINPGEVHHGYPDRETGYTYRILYPNCALLEQIFQEFMGGSKLPYFPSATRDSELVDLLFRLHTSLEQTSTQLEQESYLVAALSHLISRHSKKRFTLPEIGLEQQAVQQTRAFLDAHYWQNISLQQLADRVQLGSLRLLRAFRQQVGLPPHAYLVQVRVTRAKAALAAGTPIAQVAYETGFTDQSHLNRHFKRMLGITPGQYVLGC